MKRYDNIMQDNTIAPKTENNIWLKNDQLYYYTNGKWRLIGGGSENVTEALEKINQALEDINNLNSSDGIDSLNEIKKFLEGYKDNQTLQSIINNIEIDSITNEDIDSLFN